MPSFIDVFEFHHAPERAQHDPYLVGIISAADQFLNAQSLADRTPATETPAAPENSPSLDVPRQPLPKFLSECLPELAESEHRTVLDLLETEYLHLLPLVQLGMAATVSEND